jgi:hypothetical protein
MLDAATPGAATSPIAEEMVGPSPVKEEKDDSPAGQTPTGEGAVVKANKGMILRKSVEYIRSVLALSLFKTQR